jgi:hypothetical protein
MNDSNIFWTDKPDVLLDNFQIIPTKNMSYTKIMNLLTKFSIIMLLVYLIGFPKSNFFVLPLIAIVIIVIVYDKNKKTIKEGMTKSERREPTSNNPLMNVSPVDERTVPKAREHTDSINGKIDEYINDNKPVNKKYLDRFYYTMPSTTIPNDQDAFLKFVYPNPPTCKENSINCLKYEDIRFHRDSPDY